MEKRRKFMQVMQVEDDRLSHLPDDILDHIVSSLDADEAARTTVLSRQWRLQWNRIVPHLHKHIISSKLHDMSKSLKITKKLLEDEHSFASSSRFPYLHTLHLSSCCFFASPRDRGYILLTPTRQFLNLVELSFTNCVTTELGRRRTDPPLVIRISNESLSRLELVSCRCNFQIYAPRLRSFTLKCAWEFLEFFDLIHDIFNLDHADICVSSDGLDCFENYRGSSWSSVQGFVNLMRGIRDVSSLKLHSDTLQVLDKISEYLNERPCLFRRLKTVYVEKKFENNLSYIVNKYFIEGSLKTTARIEFV